MTAGRKKNPTDSAVSTIQPRVTTSALVKDY